GRGVPGAHARRCGRGHRHAGHRVRGDRPLSGATGVNGTLSAHAREEIDRWVAKFPAGRQRSAVIASLRVVQHENGGYLTPALMDAVAEYLHLPPVQVYEVASFYSMFET